MTKYWVFELSTESQNLFRSLAEQQEFAKEDIKNGLDSKVDDLQDTAQALAFRICDNHKCKEFFNEGYLTESDSTFCSKECAEAILEEIPEEEYGEFIFWTDWDIAYE